jgi:dTDP-4-dehydrorhamnose 3,5-epimerase
VQFHELDLPGAFIVDLEPVLDERGFFARAWDEREFTARGLEPRLVQCSLSNNRWAGTLRGLHLQVPPAAETKLVRCIRGALYDVVLDLRGDSPTFGRWTAVTISAENRRAVYVPRGCAHGFQTLADDTEIYYQISERYAPEHARGVRWNDGRFGVDWPRPITVISPKDASYPDFAAEAFVTLAGPMGPAAGQTSEAAALQP